MSIQYFSKQWGNSLGADWSAKDENITKEFGISGCRYNVKSGDYLIGECSNNILWYKLSDIEYKNNPKDLFFGKATFINGIELENLKDIKIQDCDNSEELMNSLINHKYGNARLSFC